MESKVSVRPYAKSIEDWMEEMEVPVAERVQMSHADAIALPVGYGDNPKAFATSLYDFMAFVNEQGTLNVVVCCGDEGFATLELCSVKTRLGRFLLPATIAGTVFWNILSCYIYDQAKFALPQLIQTEHEELPHYMDKPEVSFSIILTDTTGKQQEVVYDGPVEGIKEVEDIIKTLIDGNR